MTERPEWNKFIATVRGSILACTCGSDLQSTPSIREHWQMGHFDLTVESRRVRIEIVDEAEQAERLLLKYGHHEYTCPGRVPNGDCPCGWWAHFERLVKKYATR
jgi:hypothetical protein